MSNPLRDLVDDLPTEPNQKGNPLQDLVDDYHTTSSDLATKEQSPTSPTTPTNLNDPWATNALGTYQTPSATESSASGQPTPTSDDPSIMAEIAGGAWGGAKALGKGILGVGEGVGEGLDWMLQHSGLPAPTEQTPPANPLKLAAGLVTSIPEAIKQTRDITQRALAGEDVSSSEIGEAWASGALGLLGGYELAHSGLKLIGGKTVPLVKGEEAPIEAPSPKVSNEARKMVFEDFKKFSDGLNSQLPDITDIRSRFGNELEHAESFGTADDARYHFYDSMSKYVEDRTISAETAESIGGRMDAYFKAKYSGLQSFDSKVAEYAKTNNVPPEQQEGLYRHLANATGEELRKKYLSSEDWSLYDGTTKKLMDVIKDGIDLNSHAAAHGRYIDYAPDGSYLVKDVESHQILGSFNNVEEAKGALEGPLSIWNTQPPSSIDNSGASDIPPSGIGGGAMPPDHRPTGWMFADDMPHEPKTYFKLAGTIIDAERTIGRVLTPQEKYWESIDNQHFTNIGEYIRSSVRAFREMGGQAADWIKRHAELVKGMEKLDPEERAKIPFARQTMTPQEVIDSGFEKPLNNTEQNIGKMLAGWNVNTSRVLDYIRQEKNLNNMFQSGKIDAAQHGVALTSLETQFGFNQEHIQATALFKQLMTMDVDQADIGKITRLAEAIRGNTPSRGEFMMKNKFSSEARDLVSKYDELYNDLYNHFGISGEKLNGYMNHFRANRVAEDFESSYLRQPGLMNTPEAKFASDMHRTGELGPDVIDQDQAIAMHRYIRAGFKARYLLPTLNDAKMGIANELGKLDSSTRSIALDQANEFFRNITGAPDASMKFAGQQVKAIFDDMNVKLEPNVVDKLVSIFHSMAYSAYVGGINALVTLKHITQIGTMYFPRFGAVRTANMLGMIGDLINEAGDLRRRGVLSNSAPTDIPRSESMSSSPGMAQSILDKTESGWRAVANTSLRMNALKTVYEGIFGLTYLEPRTRALSLLKADMTYAERQSAYKDLFLNSYGNGFQKEFDGLVRSNKIDEAAHRLGIQTANETTFAYGKAYHPTGWSTLGGKVLGVFGQWPVQMKSYLEDMTTKGTIGERTQWIARFAIARAAISITGIKLGLDLAGFQASPSSILHLGGPVANMIGAARNLMSNSQRDKTNEMGRLKYLLPNNDIRQIYIPGSNGIYNWYQASHDPQINDLVHFLARGVGIKPSNDPKPSWIP